MSRYTLTPKGQYVPEGRKGRTLVLVDIRPTPSTRIADIFLQIRPGKDFEALTALIALVKGHAVDAEKVATTGLTPDQLQDLADRLKSARYGAIFFGMGLTMTRGKHLNTLAILSLGIELNEYTRCVAMPLRGHGNVTGGDAVTGWLTGYPFGIDFSRGYPRYNPGEFTCVDLLARREVDAALVIAADPGATMPQPAIDHLARVPTITLDPHVSHTSRLSRVHITTATTGISALGTVYRMDELPLKVRPALTSPYPSDEEVIRRLMAEVADRLRARRAGAPATGTARVPSRPAASPRDDDGRVVRLTLKRTPATPLEAEVLTPDVLNGLSRQEILELPVHLGRQILRLGDFFDVEGDGAARLELSGDLRKVKHIGRGMSGGSVAIEGSAGMHLGAGMSGGTISVAGDAGDWLGAEMRGGSIFVHGDAGGQVGAAYRGSPTGMRGGEIHVDGGAGIEVAMRMRRGLVSIMGDVGDAAGLEMKGGTLVLGARAGVRAGAWMRRGTIVAFERISILPTFVLSCTYRPSFLGLYFGHLERCGVRLPEGSGDGVFQRFTGDTSGLGKGEILRRLPATAT